MRMGIDDPWHYILAGGIDHAGVSGRLQTFADGGDLAAANQDVGVFQRATSDGQERGIPDQCLVGFPSFPPLLLRRDIGPGYAPKNGEQEYASSDSSFHH